MRPALVVVLGMSAIINAVLLVGDPRARIASGPSGSQPGGGAGLPVAANTAAAQAARLAEARTQVSRAFESTDLATLRDRLRAEGFPEPVVRALVGRRIDAAIEARRMSRYGAPVVQPFWTTSDPAEERERRVFERQLSREQRRLYADLLDTGPLGPEGRNILSERYGFLPPDKARIVLAIESDYGEIAVDARGDIMMGGLSAEDRERQQMIEREKRADIAAALSPEELELYELHYSSAANAARNRFRSFEPTEEEFRAVYALQKVIEERYGTLSGMPVGPEGAAARAAQNELNAQLKTILGESRFAEYERVNSSGYRAAVRITEHYNLPRENADAVHTLEAEYRERQRSAMRGVATSAERNELMIALAAEASARVVALLGEEGAKVFRENGGHWLRNLEQMAQRPRAPTPRP